MRWDHIFGKCTQHRVGAAVAALLGLPLWYVSDAITNLAYEATYLAASLSAQNAVNHEFKRVAMRKALTRGSMFNSC